MAFDDPLTNDLTLKMEPVWGRDKIEKIKLIHGIGDPERKERIEKLLKLSSHKLLGDGLLGDQVLLPPSSKMECFGKGDVFLGDVCYGRNPDGTDRPQYPLFLDLEDLNNHLIITGLSGVGKTCLAMNLVMGLAKKNQRCVIFDWNRQWRNVLSLSEEEHPFVKDVRLYTIGRDIHPLAWNMFFSPPPGVAFSNWIGITTGKPLQKSVLAGQGVQDYLENEAEALYDAFQKGILKLLPNIEDIQKGVSRQNAQSRQLLWKQSTERVTRELTRDSIKEVLGSRAPIDIAKDILGRDGITIIEMDIETPSHIRTLFQEVFLSYMLLYYMHLEETDQLRTQVVLEEFPNMLPSSKIELQTGTPIIKTIFREGRKWGLGLIAIAQETSELPNYVVGNAKVQCHFALQTKKDIEATANSLFLKSHQIPFIDYIWRGECIVKVKGRVKNCLIKTPLPPFKRKITDEELMEISQRWKNTE